MTANTAMIKELNKKLVRDWLSKVREATIYELSQVTGLSVVTVKTLLVDLIDMGEVREGEMVPSNGGRPSTLYKYNENYRHALVVYGCQKNDSNLIHIRVANLFGECVYHDEAFIDDVQVSSFCGYIDKAIEAFPNIAVIGFGLPGVEEEGIIISNDYCGVVGDAFMAYYKHRYDLPVIFLNDVNAAVKGYYSSHADDSVCLVGMYFPRIYPPGAGMVMNGEIYMGAHRFAGEIGHLLPGVDWIRLDYTDDLAVTEAAAALLAIYCRIIAPNQFILYGDFFSEASAKSIQMHTQRLLNEKFRVNVSASADFEKDFEKGMIVAVLEQMMKNISKDGF